MENATKALLMAAGVLIGVLILSLGVALYIMLSGYVSQAETDISENQIRTFNEYFLKYSNRTDLTIQDVITARNKALELNQSHSNYNISIKADENSYYVDVFFKRESKTNTIFDEDITELLEKYMEVEDIKCKVTISPITKQVYKLEFE